MSATYRVRILPESHELEVEFRLEGMPAGPVRVQTPTWVPGAYGFMKYGRDLFDVRAVDPKSNKDLPIRRDGWSGFVVEALGSILIRFRVYAFDPAWGELVGFVGHDQALLLGTHLLFAPAFQGPCRVEYVLPKGWALHHPSGGKRLVETVYEYPSFEVLLDTPVVAGRFERRTRTIEGTPFHFVFMDEAIGFGPRVELLVDDLARIALACRAIFGSFPFEDYTFIFTFDPQAKWGLEHANATTIALDDDTFIEEASRAKALRVCAHEIFHAWNVCRLKPAPLGRPDLDRGSFPDGLWVSEGFTRYYEFLLLARTGVITPEAFFSNVVNYYRQLVSHPAYERVSLVDSSLATFLNHNRYPGSVNATIDYYDKGMLVAFDLDVALRTGQAKDSLDAALASFYRAFVDKPEGFTHADAAAFFGSCSARARDVVAREVEAPAGLAIVQSLEKMGFEVSKEPSRRLGLVFSEKVPAEIANVVDDSPAGRSGIAPGDVVERVNGFPFKPKALAWAIAHEPRVELEVKRGARPLRFVAAPDEVHAVAGLRWRGTEAQAAAVREWLGTTKFAPQPGQALPLASYENFHGIQRVV